jgi:hypothetical protein
MTDKTLNRQERTLVIEDDTSEKCQYRTFLVCEHDDDREFYVSIR